MDFMRHTILLCCLLFPANAYLCVLEDGKDPCTQESLSDVLYMDSRDPDVPFTMATADTSYCDLYASDRGKWYKSYFNMTTYCVNQDSCGTQYPIWMDGSIPTPAEGVVDRMACLRTYTECCERKYPLRVKTCNNFTVYCFKELPSDCPQRFCFDVFQNKTTTTEKTTPTTPLPTTNRPPTTESPTTERPTTKFLATQTTNNPRPTRHPNTDVTRTTFDGSQTTDDRHMRGDGEGHCIGLPWFILSTAIALISTCGLVTILVYQRCYKTGKVNKNVLKHPSTSAVYETSADPPSYDEHIYEKPLAVDLDFNEKGERRKQ